MIRLLADEHFPHPIVAGALALDAQVVFHTVQELHLEATSDPDLLEWAAVHGYVVVSSDVRTMIGFAYDRIRAARPMTGLIISVAHLPAKTAAEDLAIIGVCGDPPDMRDRVLFLPL